MNNTLETASLSMVAKTALLDEICAAAKILPVVTINHPTQVLPMADALAAGGLKTLEVTLRSEHGLEAIRTLRTERPELCIGAGTILDEHSYQAAVDAGAQFIVTPGATPAVLQAGVESDIPLLPGVATASEVMAAYALGYRRFKLFPAEIVGGAAALKALSGPFGDIRFCPTGGVSPRNLKDYLALPNVMCVGGTWMLNAAWLRDGDWARVKQETQQALALMS